MHAFDVQGGPPTRVRNIILAALPETHTAASLLQVARDCVTGGRVRPEVLHCLRTLIAGVPDSGALLLTDDYAPIETMGF